MRKVLCSLLLLFIWLFPSAIGAKKSKGLVLCTWNIGHFSNGSQPYSLINVNDYKNSLKLYRSLVYNELRPDVIAINEYNRVFCGDDTLDNNFLTSLLLFNDFDNLIIGPYHYWGIRNAIFSKIKMKNSRLMYFESHKTTNGDDFVRSRDNYYIESDLYVDGKKVKLVCLHLLFSWKVTEVYQRKQMEELINRYKDIDRIIMCGDWNTETYSSLKNAGYIFANDGSLKTFPSKGYALDNIVVKGLEISDVRMIKTDLSDHYPLVCRISLKN